MKFEMNIPDDTSPTTRLLAYQVIQEILTKEFTQQMQKASDELNANAHS